MRRQRGRRACQDSCSLGSRAGDVVLLLLRSNLAEPAAVIFAATIAVDGGSGQGFRLVVIIIDVEASEGGSGALGRMRAAQSQYHEL